MKHKQTLALALAVLATAVGAHSAAEAAPRRSFTIALVAKSESHFVFQAARRGAVAAAQELSQRHGMPVEIVWLTPPREDAAAQAERVAQAVTQGVDAILISCSDAETLTPAIDAAVDQGVAVMTFDSDAPASRRFAFYGTDDEQMGDLVMADLAELLGGKGKIALLAGSPSAPNIRRRVEGARRAAGRHPGLQILEVVHHRETPQDAAAEVLRVNAARPDLAGWAMLGGWPLFRSSQTSMLVDDLRHRGQKVVAVDALPDEFLYVENGLVPALWAQPIYLWGKVGVETIVERIYLKKSGPEKIPMQLTRVSRANLGAWARQLKGWGFAGIPEEYLTRQ